MGALTPYWRLEGGVVEKEVGVGWGALCRQTGRWGEKDV